ncbi:MAG: hypothetical protein EAX86_07530 [Candidatus Heimdallarchaeota archaeon]|nr:hypothetical protein [Candidatus Heimdallarchaeota archaeon]
MKIPQKFIFLTDFTLLGLLFALIFASLVYFIYPIELIREATIDEIFTRALGSAFFFGAFSGFISGLVAGIWINRSDYKSPIAVGILSGILAAIIGSAFFPIIGALIRILYFGENPEVFFLEISFLINYAVIGLIPGIAMGIASGAAGGILSGDIKLSTKSA